MSKRVLVNATDPESKDDVKAAALVQSYSFSGPLPPPSLLNQYDPQTRKTIIFMAQRQSAHRQRIEQSIIQSNMRNERLGIFIASFITILLILSGVILLLLDKDAAGIASIFGPMLFHAGNYIYNRKQEEKFTLKSKNKKQNTS